MTTKHTLGPWNIKRTICRQNWVVSPRGTGLKQLNGGMSICHLFGDDALDNAYLVCAAPEMLAMLEEVKSALNSLPKQTIGQIENNLDTYKLASFVEAVIAKAKGL